MVDGKVKLHCSETTSKQKLSTRSCPICKAKPTEMAELLEEIRLICENYDLLILLLGLSPMHGWIKIMEYIFNICKTLSIGGNYNRTNTKLENECVSEEKMRIQQALRSEIGIIVDCTAQGGAGNSNCGNTGRRFFDHPETVARILQC